MFVFLPQAFDEDDSDESSESNQYVAEGQRVVNRALQQRADGSEVSALLNLAHYVPSSEASASGAMVRCLPQITLSLSCAENGHGILGSSACAQQLHLRSIWAYDAQM